MQKVIVVLLRQPHMNLPSEKRSDPFWEFGSFGTTGCHGRNLMHPKNAAHVAGSRLAFVQGGKLGFRLVLLTPPVKFIAYADRSEVRWDDCVMPFRYQTAPIVIDEQGFSDVPQIVSLIEKVNRNGWLGRFASKFRTRTEPLPGAIAGGITRVYNARLRAARRKPQLFAQTYEQALPVNPPLVDRDRLTTYRDLLERVGGKLPQRLVSLSGFLESISKGANHDV